jgi:hypothetical protein
MNRCNFCYKEKVDGVPHMECRKLEFLQRIADSLEFIENELRSNLNK